MVSMFLQENLPSFWQQFGMAGGLLALIWLVVREVFNYLKWKNDRNGARDGLVTKLEVVKSGDKPPEYWDLHVKAAVAEMLKLMVMPILEQQTKILDQRNALFERMVAHEEKIIENQAMIVTAIAELKSVLAIRRAEL